MTIQEEIKAEVDILDKDSLEALYKIIQVLKAQKPLSLMDKLRTVHINAPKDFAKNIDTYLNGEIP
ncbi:MAG: hypothetical protein ACXWT1_20970 [Methylobacter sp.]